MPGFVIFVLVLTFVYVVYFSVMITLDLHSKKDEKKTDEETIDVSSMDNEEVPVSVEEHNDGPEGSGHDIHRASNRRRPSGSYSNRQ